MSDPVGMAIEVTEDTLSIIAAVNHGVRPRRELDQRTYFLYPYDHTQHCVILAEWYFNQTYRFTSQPTTDYFVEVEKI